MVEAVIAMHSKIASAMLETFLVALPGSWASVYGQVGY